MEESQSFLQFGPYTYYIWSSILITLSLLIILFWRSQRQLTKQKQALKQTQKKHEA